MTSINIGKGHSKGVGLGLGLMSEEDTMIERVIRMINVVENIMIIGVIDMKKIEVKEEIIKTTRSKGDIRALAVTQTP